MMPQKQLSALVKKISSACLPFLSTRDWEELLTCQWILLFWFFFAMSSYAKRIPGSSSAPTAGASFNDVLSLNLHYVIFMVLFLVMISQVFWFWMLLIIFAIKSYPCHRFSISSTLIDPCTLFCLYITFFVLTPPIWSIYTVQGQGLALSESRTILTASGE